MGGAQFRRPVRYLGATWDLALDCVHVSEDSLSDLLLVLELSDFPPKSRS
jgi:hypothetical protein